MGNGRRRFTSCLVALLAATSAAACASTPPVLSAASKPSSGATTAEAAAVLDDFHAAAAHADEARYFGHFAKGGVFLGTDETERWDVPAFVAYARPRFASGKGWVFRPVRRSITVSADGNTAWFDEDLRGEKLGPARGSGVLVREGAKLLIAQYNLALTIPNERFPVVQKALNESGMPAPTGREASGALRAKHEAVYAKAVEAAASDLSEAKRLLTALAAEAEAESHREDADVAFWVHNELTWIRWAAHDIVGALEEVDAAKDVLDHATIDRGFVRTLRLHERWDRAYLLMEVAAAQAAGAPKVSSDERNLARLRALDARAAYEALAKEEHDADGMAVLEAFFAVKTGDRRRAAAAAARVDVEKDSDLQDIFVLALAADASGDQLKAKALRERICSGKTYLMKPLLLRALAESGRHCAVSR